MRPFPAVLLRRGGRPPRVCGAGVEARLRWQCRGTSTTTAGVAASPSVSSSISATTSPAGAGGGIGAEMRLKGFQHSTPNFNTSEFSDATDPADLAHDIVTESATGVDYVRDIYGPWLVMTDDLQGELFFDHDKFVFYRPANGLGYGIGKVQVLDAGATGTAFTCQLESYTYQPTDSVVPQYGLTFDITGMVKRVTTKSSNYATFSLVGVWRRRNRNHGATALLPSQRSETSPAAEAVESPTAGSDRVPTSGQFHAAKLSPWDPSTAAKPFAPSAELQHVFAQVFPEPLQAESHVRRAEAHGESPATRHLTGGASDKPPPATHLDMAPFAVGTIPGIYYIPDYISAEEEARMLKFIGETPQELKSKLTKRTCQEWGCTMCDSCQKSFVSDANMPPWVQESIDMQVYDGLFTPTTFPNSVRVHEYQQGDGIGPHCDGPIYVPMVTVLSLASSCLMCFYPKQPLYENHPMDHYNDTFKFGDGDIGRRAPLQSVVMEPRSLLVFSGEGYYHYPHGVSDRAEDVLTPELVGEVVNRRFLRDPQVQSIPRTYRASITTRNLMTRCSHQPQRAEYAMKRAWYLYNHLPIPAALFPPAPQLPTPAPLSTPGRTDAAAGWQASRQKRHTPALAPVTSDKMALGDAGLQEAVRELRAGQEELRHSVEELRQLMALSIPAHTTFQTETATILNHLSSSVLRLESKLEDVLETVEAIPKPL
ncbi:2OG-Fe(II) oxygenase superfamily [Novymonas esmeraldas]|uniref:2OG-Fe(II) oxygenase superfamily n=1 Tax=Novymonas esmeraldas TaxID=1808958 RepID=A0AAW0F5Q3_9TRYP